MKNVTKFMLLASMIIGATSCSSVDGSVNFFANEKMKSDPCNIKLDSHMDSTLYDILIAHDSLKLTISGMKSTVIDNRAIRSYALSRQATHQPHDTDQYIVVYARAIGSLAKYRCK